MKSSISGHLLGKRSSLWRTWSSAHSGSRRRFKSGNRVGRRESAVRAAIWRTGNLEPWDPRGAARGGSTRARRCPECPRGAHSGGGRGLPHGPAARVPRGGREVRSVRTRATADHGAFDSGPRSHASPNSTMASTVSRNGWTCRTACQSLERQFQAAMGPRHAPPASPAATLDRWPGRRHELDPVPLANCRHLGQVIRNRADLAIHIFEKRRRMSGRSKNEHARRRR